MINTVILGDCMEYMATLPDKAFDLAIVDPEYGDDKIFKGSALFANDFKQFKNIRPNKKYFLELFRISEFQIVAGGNYFTDFLPVSRCWIIWDKILDGFSSVHNELFWTSFDSAINIFRRHQGLDKGFMNKEIKNIHPTQKPIALYKWLLANYAKPGWKIFDSHVGSGSSRIACHDMGFDFTGCELDPDYWKAQEERYQNHIAQKDLISPTEIQALTYKEEELPL